MPLTGVALHDLGLWNWVGMWSPVRFAIKRAVVGGSAPDP